MTASTDNTYYESNYTVVYYNVTSATSTACTISTVGSTSSDYYATNYDDCNPDIWNLPRPMVDKPRDIFRSRPVKKIVAMKNRHIAPMHFRHVRTQQRKT